MINQVNVGETFFLDIKRIGINGEGIAYYKKQTIFVKNALPKEVVNVKITEVKNGYAYGEAIEIKTPSINRVEPFCKYANKCGGCQLTHIKYDYQLELKRDLISQAISRYTNVNPKSFEIRKVIGMDNPLHYRNKSSLPVRFDQEKAVLGIYEMDTNQVCFIDTCLVQHDEVNRINEEVLRILDRFHIYGYNPKTNKGDIRYLVTRVGIFTEEAQVTLVMRNNNDFLPKAAEEIMKIKNVKSVFKDFNDDPKSHEIFGKKLEILAGKKTILENLKQLSFDLTPSAFMQLNPVQAIKLYDEVLKACKLSKKESVLDAYSGVGTIGLWVSKMAKKVVGIEYNKDAVMAAETNALKNHVVNASFQQGDVMKLLPKLKREGFVPDIMIFDPPRVGLGEEICRFILKNQAPRIVYVSCNPSTLAKDLSILLEKYAIKYIQPVDMFPHTASVESVCLLELKK